MDVLINLGIYLAICMVIIAIMIGGVYLKKKFNIKNSEIVLGEKIIGLLVYIVEKGNFKYSGDVTVVAKYVIQAVDFINSSETYTDIAQKKQAIEDEALRICKDNNINVDPELVGLVSDITDYFVK